MLAQAHPGQPGGVEVRPEQVQPELLLLIVVQGLEPDGHRLVGAQGVGRLVLRALGVPCLPDRWERLRPGRVLPAQARVEEQAENLGLGPEMGQHLGDRPVRRVGLSLQLVRAERAGHRSQPFVRVPQGFNPRGGTGLHAGSP